MNGIGLGLCQREGGSVMMLNLQVLLYFGRKCCLVVVVHALTAAYVGV